MGRKTTLTEELVAKLEFYWQLVADTLTDEEIACKVGVSIGQLKGWLQRNVRPQRADGSLSSTGLRDIRERAKASTPISYLVKLNNAADRAAAAGYYGVAIRAWKWLLERQFPKQYGPKSAEQIDQQSASYGVALLPAPVSEEQSERDAMKLGPRNAREPAQEDKKPCAPDAPPTRNPKAS